MIPDCGEPVALIGVGAGTDHHRYDGLAVVQPSTGSMVDISVGLVASVLRVVVPYEHGDAGHVGSAAEELEVILAEGVGTFSGLPYAAILTEVTGDALVDVCPAELV